MVTEKSLISTATSISFPMDMKAAVKLLEREIV